MKNGKALAKRMLLYFIGYLVMAVGVTLSVNSDLGMSPVNSLPYAVCLVTGVSLGTCVSAVFIVFVLAQIALLRRDFRPASLLQIVFTVIFGFMVDAVRLLFGDLVIPTYAGRLLTLAISVVLIGTGLALYMGADIIPLPAEGLVAAVTDKQKHFSFHQIKTMFDCLYVLLAAVVTFLGTGHIVGLREGTIIAALLLGKLMSLFSKLLRPFILLLNPPLRKEPELIGSVKQAEAS